MAAAHARWQRVPVMPVFLGKADVEGSGSSWKSATCSRESFPGVRTLFEHLQDVGIRIALASSAKENELEVCKQVVDIANSMHEHTSSSDAEKSRLRLRILPAILEKLGHPWPGDVVMVVVGKMLHDSEAGGKVGLRMVGVLRGGFSGQNLHGVGCIPIYCDPADLPAYLDRSPLAWELAS